MEFWNNIVNVSEEAARLQISIISNFDIDKKSKLAFEFSNFGIERTREWIKQNNPWYSVLEINLEFVKLTYYETGQMPESHWEFYKKAMLQKIKKDWITRFRKMMKEQKIS